MSNIFDNAFKFKSPGIERIRKENLKRARRRAAGSALDAAATLQIQKMMKGDPPKSKTYTREQPKQSNLGSAATVVKLMGSTLKKLSVPGVIMGVMKPKKVGAATINPRIRYSDD